MSGNQNHRAKQAIIILMMILSANFVILFDVQTVSGVSQIVEQNEIDSGGKGIQIWSGNTLAQGFTASTNITLAKVSLYVKDLQDDDNLNVEIYSNDDLGDGISNNDRPQSPLGPASVNNTGIDWVWLDFPFGFALAKGQRYWIVASCSRTPGSKSYEWQDSAMDSYPNGYIASGSPGNWILDTGNDLMFRVYGDTLNDVGVSKIQAPEVLDVNVEVNITAQIKNFGSNNQGSFDVRCMVYDPLGVEVFNNTQPVSSLDSGALENISWLFTPAAGGIYSIVVTTLLVGDDYAANNQKIAALDVIAPSVMKLHSEITVDGAVGDWVGTPPSQDNSGRMDKWEYIWKDAQGDDVGDGDYVYPANPRFESNPLGCLDLLEFRVCVDSDSVNFLLDFGSIDDFIAPTDGSWGDLVFSEQIIEILVDCDSDGTGRVDTLRNARLRLDDSIGWEFALWADGWDNGYITDESGNIYKNVKAKGSPATNSVEISIPLSVVPSIDFETWKFVVLIGAQDNNSLAIPVGGSTSGFMNVDAVASLTGGGGGLDANGPDSNVYDMAFAKPQSPQLFNYNSTDILFAAHTDTSSVTSSSLNSAESWAQSFLAPSTVVLLSAIKLYALDEGTDSLLNITIQTNDDKGNADPSDDVPSGINITTLESINLGVGYSWQLVPLTQPPVLHNGERYWIVATSSESPGNGNLWARKTSSSWPSGASASRTSGVWTQQSNDDMLFEAYFRKMTTVNAYRSVYFAPVVINEIFINGSADSEYITLYYNGTIFSQDLDLTGWMLSDSDGNDFVFGNFPFSNKNTLNVHLGFGTNSSADVFMSSSLDVFNDFGDDILLVSAIGISVDFVNYTNGLVFGDPPPSDVNWGPKGSEPIPRNPGKFHVLTLSCFGCDYNFYSDWTLKAWGIYAIKSLYLYDDGAGTTDDIADFMNTTFPNATSVANVDGDGQPGLTLKKPAGLPKINSYHEFYLSPALASNLFIIDDVIIDLYVDDDYTDMVSGAAEVLNITLYDWNGTAKIEIATQIFSFTTDSTIGWEPMSFTIADVVYNILPNHYLVLNLSMGDSQNDLLLAYNTTDQPSSIRVLPTRTFVNVNWAKTYDLALLEKTDFVLNETVVIRANITDPFGSHDIKGANITIITPGGFEVVSDIPMTLMATQPGPLSFWKLFEFNFTGTNQTGIYTIIVKGVESNGVVFEFTIYFTVLGGLAPGLTDPQVNPPSGYTNTPFNFTVNYTDSDNDPPSEIFVVITGLGTFNLSAVNPGDTDYTDGAFYYFNIQGLSNKVSYFYQFLARDAKGLLNQTPQFPGPVILNSPPVLTNWTLTPFTGKASTDFNYSVIYQDLDNDPPGNITVNITGPSHSGPWILQETDPSDTDYTDGKQYHYNFTGLFNGTYTHHFAANDTLGEWTWTFEIPGPEVEISPLSLLFPGVTPTTGYITTEFNYTVTYLSLDNQPPLSMLVNITGPSHFGSWVMQEADPFDVTYTDGKVYFYLVAGLVMGSYSFHCAGTSLGLWNETIEVALPAVLNQKPELADFGLEPLVGNAGTTLFNYTVTYTDLDNHAPFSVTLNITGPFQGEYAMIEVDSGDTNYTDGKDYYFTTTLPISGIYTFKITANDSMGLFADPLNSSGPNVDSPYPVLFRPRVDPKTGTTLTWFNFTVVFADLQNDSASSIFLNLTGPKNYLFALNELDPLDTNTTDGKIYFVNISGLKKGDYTFFVEAQDNMTNTATSATWAYPLVVNLKPDLAGGFSNESDLGGAWFNFTATYTDLDNDSAGGVYLNLGGYGNFTLIELDALDTDVTDGKEYFINISLPKGTYDFRFEANDTGIQSTWTHTAFTQILLRNNIPLFITLDVNPPAGFGGDDFNFSVEISDYDNDTLLVVLYIAGDLSGSFPANEVDLLDSNTKDGKVYFFNLTLPKGTYSYNFWVSDGGGVNISFILPFTVSNSPPVINTTDVTIIAEDSFYLVDYNFTDKDGDGVQWSLETNASWLSMEPLLGLLFGTPTNLHVGSYFVNVSCDDLDGGLVFSNFTLVVTNIPPLITTMPITSIDEDLTLFNDFNCTDDGQGIIIYSLTTNATWITINPVTGIIFGTPSGINIGWYWVNISVSDGNGDSDSMNYTLTVNNRPPAIITLPITEATEDSLHIDDFNSDNDIPGVTQYFLSSNASWLSVSPSTGILSGTPDNTQVGSYWVNVTVDDKTGILGYLNYTLTVTNNPPAITMIPPDSVIEDSLLIVDFNCDDDGQGAIIYHLASNATWLSLNPSTGVLSGNCDNTDVGWFWINVSVEDGNGGWDFLNFTLSVVNVPPVISTVPPVTVPEDLQYIVDFNSDEDGFGNVLYSLETNATWLSIDPLSGVLNGSTNNTQVGSYWVNVTVSDGKDGIDFKNFTLTVINSLPLITTTPLQTVYEGVLYQCDFDSVDDGQGVIIYSLATNASWLSIDNQTGEVSGTPFATEIGSYFVNVTVDDGQGGIFSVNFTLTVLNANDPPQIISSNVLSAVEDSQYFVDYEYSDPDGDQVTWSLSTNASWLSINPATGVLSGTPRNEHVGWFVVNVTASDGQGGVDFTQFVISVSNTNDNPEIPTLVFPQDDSLINTTFPRFSWNASSDPDIGDFVVYYTLQYSTSANFNSNTTTIINLEETFFIPTVPLEDRTTYYWRVSALDSNNATSGFSTNHYVFAIDTGYRAAVYKGGLKSAQVKWANSWTVDLDAFFDEGSVTSGLTFTCNYAEVDIDPQTHIATWTPKDKKTKLTNVTFTISDGITNVTSHPIDLSVEKITAAPTFLEMIFWPWPLLSLVVVAVLIGLLIYRRIIYAPFVERVFLIHEHSILITHKSIAMEHDVDEDILSGMLAGVKNLISDAFGRDEEGTKQQDLRKLEFGDRNILLERGNHFFLAVVFTGKVNKDLTSKIKGVVAEIEEKYTEQLAGWEGYTDSFTGVDEIIAKLLPTETQRREKKIKETYVDVPRLEDEFDATSDITSEFPGVTVTPEVYPEEILIKPPEEDKTKELPPEKDLQDLLAGYAEEPEDRKPELAPLPPPLVLDKPDRKETVFKKRGKLSEKDLESLPPPPWFKAGEQKSPEKREPETAPAFPLREEVPSIPPLKEEPRPVTPPPKKGPLLKEEPELEPLISELESIADQEIEEVLEYECPSCGSPVTADMTKCKKCGVEFRFGEGPAEDFEEFEYECPSCGSPVSLVMKKCPNCGIEFISD